MTSTSITRRSVAAGLAWTAPTVAAVAISPFATASPVTATISSYTYFGQADYRGTAVPNYNCGTNNVQQEIRQTRTPAITVSGIPSGVTITSIVAEYWLPVATGMSTTWTSKNSQTCWSIPTATGTGRNPTNPGDTVVYTIFRSVYSGPTSITGGTWNQPSGCNFDFLSSCLGRRVSTTYHYRQTVTLSNGWVLVKDNGWTNTMS